jgi:hypothetical protein
MTPLFYPCVHLDGFNSLFHKFNLVRRTNNRTVGPSDTEHSLSPDTYIPERGGVRVHNALTCFSSVFIIPHQVETSSTRRSHAALAVEFSIAD